MSIQAQTPTGEDRAKIIAALRRGDTYAAIVKTMRLPSTWPVKVIAKEEGIYRGAQGRIVTREELDRQVALGLATKGKAPVATLALPVTQRERDISEATAAAHTSGVEPAPTVMAESDSLRQRVLNTLVEHGAFPDGRALLDAVRGPGDVNISMDRLGVLLYQMRKENLIKADERKSPNGAAADHGSTRLVNVRLSERMAKADPELAQAIHDMLRGLNRTLASVEAVRDEVRKTRPSATRGAVILALRDLKAAGRVEYDSRKVGPIDVLGIIRSTADSTVVGAGPVIRRTEPSTAAPATVTPTAAPASTLSDVAVGRWPRLAELRTRAVEARAKAKAASRLVDAAALLEEVDPEAFELLMARAETANKATLSPVEEEYLTFAAEGGITRCIGVTLPGDPCGGYRGHDGRHYPKPS